jgi:hypothetical protein
LDSDFDESIFKPIRREPVKNGGRQPPIITILPNHLLQTI